MSKLISIETLIKEAKKEGVNFGKGDPYNRLRYYTKIGWLPHMVRQRDSKGDVIGHYPPWALERLLTIEDLKKSGYSNDEITKKLQVQNRIQSVITTLKSKELRGQIISYATILLLVLIVANEAGIVGLGRSKQNLLPNQQIELPNQIIDSGNAFIPKNQKSVYVKNPIIRSTSKVYITFNQDYSPASRFWVEKIDPYAGFLVELDAPSFSNAEFNWWISN